MPKVSRFIAGFQTRNTCFSGRVGEGEDFFSYFEPRLIEGSLIKKMKGRKKDGWTANEPMRDESSVACCLRKVHARVSDITP